MFRAAYRSSSGALNCICILWFIYPCGAGRCPGWVETQFPHSLDNDRSPHGCINQRLFRAAYRSSSGAPNYLQPLIYIHMWWPAVVKCEWELPLELDYGRSPHAYVDQRLQIPLELLMMSGIPLESCWAVNERWNNKFCYNVASCWLFLLNHTTMHGSMNIKLKKNILLTQ